MGEGNECKLLYGFQLHLDVLKSLDCALCEITRYMVEFQMHTQKSMLTHS